MLIKTTKDGRAVEMIGEEIHLAGQCHAKAITPLRGAILAKARKLHPNAAYVAGKIVLSASEGERAQAELLRRQRARWAAEEAALELACPGLAILRAAVDDSDRYHRQFNAMMEDGTNDGVRSPRQPAADIDALRAQYPRAAAYMRAESYSCASNHHKAAAGVAAMAVLAKGGEIAAADALLDNWLPASAAWD